MNKIGLLVVVLLFLVPQSHAVGKCGKDFIVIENVEMSLVLSTDGKAISLKHKPTGQECLEKGTNYPVFALTEFRPYDNELFLTYPAKPRTFAADTLWREGNSLKVGFEEIAYTATISLNITNDYIGFKLTALDYEIEKFGIKRRTEIDEFTLLQLPVKKRRYFGEWLNVEWDDKVAVNVLATDEFARIDAFDKGSCRLLYAGMDNRVKLMNVGAALITTTKEKLLDRIEQLERDYQLPLGVESRRQEAYKYSYYELRNVTTENIDKHIAFARKGGFKMMVIYYVDFAKSMGHFNWRTNYPNGMKDLQTITQKIKDAGMIPGFHIHYNKAAKNDTYVSPVPDARLNLRRIFTLADSIGVEASTIQVEENPEGCTMENGRRLLKIGNELVSYSGYTTQPPYQFTGCRRGELGTTVKAVEKGFKFGLLDVDTWPLFIRFDQKTNIQNEVGERIGRICQEAGFEFIYFDGAEDVHPPYWYNVPKAQLEVYNNLNPDPVCSEGATKSHFSWHMITRGNAFDLFQPEYIREATQKYPMYAAEYTAQDFTSINFGWNDYLAPDSSSTGMQPDMYEYICSRAAAWDCPIALMGKLQELEKHPRTADNLAVVRNWEEVRINDLLTKEQKEELKNPDQEHILLKNEDEKFELIPYQQLDGMSEDLRAFWFRRDGKTWVVYWHVRGEARLHLPIAAGKIQLLKQPGVEMNLNQEGEGAIVPVGDRRFLILDVPPRKVKDLWMQATLP
ncbi:hypothetical protein [Sunxiuqinia rutila]|uniref:hypothetical protein n=1 Tax=Sunxiuqinia rutila TaxID=1397841 RepID=UPI003D36D227